MQLPRHIGPVEPPQGGRHIRQQGRRDDISQRNPRQTRDKGEDAKFDRNQRHQAHQWHPQRTQRAEHGAPLFEGQPDGSVDDEDADCEGQKAKGRQIEMKALRQPGHIRLHVRLRHMVSVGQGGYADWQRFGKQQTPDFTTPVQQPVGIRNIEQDRARWAGRIGSERQWQLFERGDVVRVHDRQRIGPVPDRIIVPGCVARETLRCRPGKCQWFDAHHPKRASLDVKPPLQHRADQPAKPAQGDVGVDRYICTFAPEHPLHRRRTEFGEALAEVRHLLVTRRGTVNDPQ